MTDSSALTNLISQIKPDEIYNLAAQSHVAISFNMPEYTSQVDALGTLRVLESMRSSDLYETKFYQASTSELYGDVVESPQSEKTPFRPRSPYAISKLYSYWLIKNYREAYNMHASNGILPTMNHLAEVKILLLEITRGLARIKYGLDQCLYLGNIDSKRDWGHAKDYVYAQWLITQQEQPDDYVIATGETRSVREFCQIAAERLGMHLKFEGSGVDEVGIDQKTGSIIFALIRKIIVLLM